MQKGYFEDDRLVRKISRSLSKKNSSKRDDGKIEKKQTVADKVRQSVEEYAKALPSITGSETAIGVQKIEDVKNQMTQNKSSFNRQKTSKNQADTEVITFPDNSTYEGKCKESVPHGDGKIVYKDGTRYEGGWHNGKAEGFGKLLFPDTSEYVGNWVNGKYHGQGMFK